MNEQEYYRQLVSDAEVINALLRDGQARETGGVVAEKPRARPNLNFIQRTITNMVSSNQRKISEQDKRIETEKKKNKDYIARKPREIYYKQKKEKWTEEEILAHKKAMLACRISFIRAVEGIPAPERTGIFQKPSLSKACELKKGESERKSRSEVKLEKTGTQNTSPSIVICDSDEEKNDASSTEKLCEETKKYRPSSSSNSASSSSNDDCLKDTISNQNRKKKGHRRKKRHSKLRASSSSSNDSDRRYSRSISRSSCSSVEESTHKAEKYYKRRRKHYSSSSSDSSYQKQTSKQMKRQSCSNSRSSSSSSSVICIQESESESYTPSKYSERGNKKSFHEDYKNKTKKTYKKQKICGKKKRRKRCSSSSMGDGIVCVPDTLKNKTKYDKKQKICSRKKKRKKHRISSSPEDDVVCVTDSHIVSIVITDSDCEGGSSYTPEYKSQKQ